jgi:hypothetical protein
MHRTLYVFVAVLCTLALSCVAAFALWTIVPNPQTTNPEAIWLNPIEGESSATVLYSYLEGASWSEPTTLAENGQIAAQPKMAFSDNGDLAAVWVNTADEIVLRKHTYETSQWADEIFVSNTGDVATNPSALAYGNSAFVSYEIIPGSGGRKVEVSLVDPEPAIERTLVRTTQSSDPLHAELHTEWAVIWLDWIDSTSNLGYSVWSTEGGWGTVQFESYTGTTDIDAARERIRGQVTP